MELHGRRAMKGAGRVGLAGCLVAGAVGLGVPAAEAAPAPGWRVVKKVSAKGEFQSVAAVSAKRAWAVLSAPMDGNGAAALLRWNGKKWSKQKLPASYSRYALGGVEATSANNVWLYGVGKGHKPFLARWNGKTWKKVPAPLKPYQKVTSLLVRGPKNVWFFTHEGGAGHYNGTKWRTYKLDMEPVDSAAHGGTVWVAGYEPEQRLPRIAVWKGGKWTYAALPNGETAGFVSGITALGPKKVRAVGDDGSRGALYSWDGGKWKVTRAPGTSLRSVVPDGSGGLWASSRKGGVYRYKGGKWTRASIKGGGKSKHPLVLVDLARIPGTKASVWAVGGHYGGRYFTDDLIFKYGK